MKMNLKWLLLFFFLFIFISFSCKEDPPVIPPPPPVLKDTLTVAVTDVTHRSASLNVQCTMNNVQSQIRLYRLFNSTETLVSEFPITVQDTTIIDDNNGTGLQLNTNYFYFVVRIDTLGERKDTSNIVEAATLDTTSHNYTWQEFVIGEWQSALYDVWGTDENNVWVGGTVIINDTAYGVLKWDGSEFIPNKKIGGVQAIFGFNNSDIWAVGGGAVEHFNGTIWSRIDAKVENGHLTILDPILFNNNPYTSIWGTSSSNLYLGNQWGKIIHWDGSKASVVSENTGMTLNDIDGINSNFIIGIGTDFTPPGLAIYFDGNIWSNYPFANNSYSLNSVAIINTKDIYFGGDGIFETKRGSFSKLFDTGYYVRDLEYNRQTGLLVVTGAFDGLHIFNGSSWKNYKSFVSTDNSAYDGVFLINNTIFIVGSNDQNAKILIGKIQGD